MRACRSVTPLVALVCGILASLLPSTGWAACGITSATLASFITEATPPMRHGATASAYTRLTATFSGPGGGSDADCRIAFRSSTGRVTLFSDPTKSISYSIATLRTGGSVLSYTASPSAFISVTRGAQQFDLYMVIPDGNHSLGTYFDSSASLEVYDGAALVVSTTFQSAPPQIHFYSPTEDSCTIGSTFEGGTRALDFSNGSTISLVQQFATFGDVTCSGAADVVLSSANGAATNSSSVSTGSFQNYFDYVATTTINGAAVTLDTSQRDTTGIEESVTEIVPAGIANAPLSIGVTPKQPAKRLPAGGYADVLTINIIAR